MTKRAPSPLATPDVLERARFNASDFALDQAELATAAAAFATARLRGGRSSTGGRGDAPPKVTRGERVDTKLVIDDGRILEIPARRGWGGDSAFVDWINFTVRDSTFEWEGSYVVTDDQLMCEASAALERIFGFGITAPREKGANFYKRSYTLGDSFGMVCHGGQRRTMLISVSGEGLAAAKEGWELRLHDFLQNSNQGRITRIDLAHDDFTGSMYSVDKAFEEFKAGRYSCGGRMPDCEQRGNWLNPNGKGRTFYVGHRTNGKFARIYEKGKQLGDKSSEWVRCEVEFKSVDREIPFDVILKAGEYLAAAYPTFEWICETASRIATQKKATEITYLRVVDWVKRQAGAAIWTVAQIEGNIEAAFALLSKTGEVPKRLKIPAFDSNTDFIHTRKREIHPEEMFEDFSTAAI